MCVENNNYYNVDIKENCLTGLLKKPKCFHYKTQLITLETDISKAVKDLHIVTTKVQYLVVNRKKYFLFLAPVFYPALPGI